MIQVNLLPPEHRASTGTPVVRFVAIVAGVVMVVGASCAYAYTHFIQLARVREVEALRQEEAASKDAQRERSLALQSELSDYEQRRKAIQTINRKRILWSRKLDQFFDVVSGRDAPYAAWLDELEVPTQLATNRRQGGGVAGPGDGGEMKFSGFLAMEAANEALAQNGSFYKALTGDPDTTRQSSEFFADFLSISNPTVEILTRGSDRENLTPPVVAAIRYGLKLRSRTPQPGAAPGR